MVSGNETAPLRVALLVYRGNPTCGGQGVYVRHLSRQLVSGGHSVTVFSGQPYPELDAGVELVKLPSLDLYRDEDPFRRPRLRELQSGTDAIELATMFAGGFGEPRSFARRAHLELSRRRGEFDIVHDDQCLGSGLLTMVQEGWPLVASIHHPVTIDRALDLEAAATKGKRLSLRRWYGFAEMQARVARRLPRILTVSESSRRDIVGELGVAPERIAVVPAGVDPAVYRPMPGIRRVPGRIMATASADVVLQGLLPLLDALAKLRVECEEAHLVVIGRLRADSPAAGAIERLGLTGAVRFVSGESDAQLARRYAEAEVAVRARRCTRASRSRRSRRWRVASRSSRRPAARCPRSSATDGGAAPPRATGGSRTRCHRHRPAAFSSPRRRRAEMGWAGRRRAIGAVHLGSGRRAHGAGVPAARSPRAGVADRRPRPLRGGRRWSRPRSRVRRRPTRVRDGEARARTVAFDADGGELAGVDAMFEALRASGEIAAAGSSAVAGDALGLPFKPRSFDVVIASEVLEHIADDEAALGGDRPRSSPVARSR